MTFPIKPEKVSAREVIRKITKQSDPKEISDAVDAALLAQFENARLYQLQKKRSFELTFTEFLSLITPSRRKRMEQKMAEGQFEKFMKSNFGYVLTWKNRAALKSGVMKLANAQYLNREDSERVAHFGPGDTHTEASIDLIRKARTGKKASETTTAKMRKAKIGKKRDQKASDAISAGLKGKPKSDEHIARMREAAQARWAKAREEKATQA